VIPWTHLCASLRVLDGLPYRCSDHNGTGTPKIVMQGVAGPLAAPKSGYPPTREVIDLTLDDDMDLDEVIPISNPTVSFF
jgi:hypothetical protein